MKRSLWTLLVLTALLAAACQPLGPPPPGAPDSLVLRWPAPGEAVDAQPVLQWDPFPGATHYEVAIADRDTDAMLVHQDTNEPLFSVNPPLPLGAGYHWTVQAQDDTHAVLAELDSFFSVKALLGVVWPASGEAVGAQPVLQWQPMAAADHYQVILLNDAAYPPEVLVDQRVAKAQYAVAAPLAPGSYSWTVWAQTADNIILAELNSQFVVQGVLELLEPAAGAVMTMPPTIRWQGYLGATHYQVIVVNPANPAEPIVDHITTATQLRLQKPFQPQTEYALTVRALDKQDTVLAEANRSFTVDVPPMPAFDCAAVSELPAAECQALIVLYTETGGANWAGRAGWLTDTTPCDWPGVACEGGHVAYLSLHAYGLSGPLPAALADLSELRSLGLSNNALTGPIPAELSRLARLAELDLAYNNLSGGLPAELAQLPALEALRLNHNGFTGPIPPAWGSFTLLRSLDLGSNALSGLIPPELARLAQLQSLRLGRNLLSGPIPAELGHLPALTELDLRYNALTGPVPDGVLALQQRALWGNPLDGAVRCEGAPPMPVDFQGVSFICHSSLASSVWPETMSAVPAGTGGPFWDPRPAHLRFTLAGAPGADTHAFMGITLDADAQILVYPTADYAALDPVIQARIQALRTLLAAQPATVDGEVPVLPLNNAQQVLHAQLAYLRFENGSGVRFLTQDAQDVRPINNQDLYYTFQGLTDDGAYYVAAFFPAALSALPPAADMDNEDYADFMAGFQTYLTNTLTLLNAQPAEAFTPDLALIDRLIQSLRVH